MGSFYRFFLHLTRVRFVINKQSTIHDIMSLKKKHVKQLWIYKCVRYRSWGGSGGERAIKQTDGGGCCLTPRGQQHLVSSQETRGGEREREREKEMHFQNVNVSSRLPMTVTYVGQKEEEDFKNLRSHPADYQLLCMGAWKGILLACTSDTDCKKKGKAATPSARADAKLSICPLRYRWKLRQHAESVCYTRTLWPAGNVE